MISKVFELNVNKNIKWKIKIDFLLRLNIGTTQHSMLLVVNLIIKILHKM